MAELTGSEILAKSLKNEGTEVLPVVRLITPGPLAAMHTLGRRFHGTVPPTR